MPSIPLARLDARSFDIGVELLPEAELNGFDVPETNQPFSPDSPRPFGTAVGANPTLASSSASGSLGAWSTPPQPSAPLRPESTPQSQYQPRTAESLTSRFPGRERSGGHPVVRPAPKIDWASLGVNPTAEPPRVQDPPQVQTPTPTHTPLSAYSEYGKPAPTQPSAGISLNQYQAQGKPEPKPQLTGLQALMAEDSVYEASNLSRYQQGVPAITTQPQQAASGLAGWNPGKTAAQTQPARKTDQQIQPGTQMQQSGNTNSQLASPRQISLGDWTHRMDVSQPTNAAVKSDIINDWTMPSKPASPQIGINSEDTVLLRRVANTEQPRRGTSPQASSSQNPDAADAKQAWQPKGKSNEDTDAPPKKKRRGLKIVLIIVGIIVAVLVGMSIMWALSQGDPSTHTVPPPEPVSILTAEQLSGVGNTNWESAAAGSNITVPSCSIAELSGTESIDSTDSLGFISTNGKNDHASFTTFSFADSTLANGFFSQKLKQIGDCPANTALLLKFYEVSNLADQSLAASFLMQVADQDYHTLLFSRTGSIVTVFDVSSSQNPPNPLELAAAVTDSHKTMCDGGSQGACPGLPAVTEVVPPAVGIPGWLATVDLPLLTKNVGVWGSEPAPTTDLKDVGTQCEGPNFPTLSDAETAQHLTYILGDDPNNPPMRALGIDQLIYQFKTNEEAREQAENLISKINTCGSSGSTAVVIPGTEFQGIGRNSYIFSAATFFVEQRTNKDETVQFRVAVVFFENLVTYLMANPTGEYDFSQEQWDAIAQRAGQRLSQF
ncbi:MAG: hypothetical protein FWG47_07050 [Propionibacteriaceae bacterium]|nr:hypothetical protein [Propionibacteriaceae bacterium]